jgi:hypothetical protein
MKYPNLKHLVFSFLIFSFFLMRAQEKSKWFKKNSDAYRVTEVKYNSKRNDYCAVKFGDAVVFTSSRKRIGFRHIPRDEEENVHLFTTEKTSTGKDRPPVLFLPDLKTTHKDGPVCFDKEGSAVFFSRNRSVYSRKSSDGVFKYKLFEARLNAIGIDTVILFPFNSNDFNIVHPSLSDSGNVLYFASDMPGGFGGMDIYYSKKTNGEWGKPVNLGKMINTKSEEVYPFIASNNVLFFSSDAPGGMGGLDIYESKIVEGKGQKAYNMGDPVNSLNDDFGYFMRDGYGFISSNRKRDGKDDNIYEYQLLREVKRGKQALIVTIDKATGAVLPKTQLTVNEEKYTTNNNGEYLLTVDEGLTYAILAQKNDYYDVLEGLSFTSNDNYEFTVKLLFEKDPHLALSATITDIQTGLPLSGVTVKVKDLVTNRSLEKMTTAADGKYDKAVPGKKMNDRISFNITIDKPGYTQKTFSLSDTLRNPGVIDLNKKFDMSLTK